MTDDPSPDTLAPLPPPDPTALDSFRDAGWVITSSPQAHVWIATRIVGSASRTIAANTAGELLERLIATEEAGQPERRPAVAPTGIPRSDSQERMST